MGGYNLPQFQIFQCTYLLIWFFVPVEYFFDTFIANFNGLLTLGFNKYWLVKQTPWLVKSGLSLKRPLRPPSQQGSGVKSISQ